MKRPRIAAIVTEYRRYSHAQHIVDRFLYGYGFHGQHHRPAMDIVSLFTDQVPQSDLSRSRSKDFPGMKIYPSIAKALTRGGDKLAVDGVLLIGEHGRYPNNEKGQRLYPRYEFFQEIVKVFKSSKRSVPVFNDKHLSWRWDWAKKMVEQSKELGFAFLAGSSLPCARRIPSVELPAGAEIEEAVVIAPGGPDGYDIHALESVQCIVERRKGGEQGVKWIDARRDQAVWNLVKKKSFAAGGCDRRLLTACLCRSHTLMQPEPGFNHALPDIDKLAEQSAAVAKRQGRKPARPTCYRYEHLDGLKVTMLLIESVVSDFNVAVRFKDPAKKPLSTQLFLPPREVCNFFSPQVHAIEHLFTTGKTLYPIERTLLTTGVTAAGVESLYQKKRLETPHLRVRYRAPKSHFWKA